VTRPDLERLVALAARAARAVLEVYQGEFAVEYKGPRDPVTAADLRAHALLVEGLGAAFPGVPVVSEEGDPASFRALDRAERALFVDPLDGTREFIDRNGEFVVMIGLVEAGRATAGVVHAPVAGTAWAGRVGAGAWRVPAGGGRWEPVRVSAEADLARARLVASRSHRTGRLERALAALGAAELRRLGSAGLKGAEVAAGLAEAYVHPGGGLRRWDTCALDALVRAAGGEVTDLAGAPLAYGGDPLLRVAGLVASNGATHEAILRRLG
jgi:3'(2'), 5'-bisphosphate nucleotidase